MPAVLGVFQEALMFQFHCSLLLPPPTHTHFHIALLAIPYCPGFSMLNQGNYGGRDSGKRNEIGILRLPRKYFCDFGRIKDLLIGD